MRPVALVRALWVVMLWLAASASQAQPSLRTGLGLNWVRLAGAEACIGSVDLMNRIEQSAGRILFVRTGDAFLTLDGYVKPTSAPEGWAVTFEVSDARGKVLGRRELGVLLGGDCGVVTSAADLIFDLLLEPEGLLASGIALEPATQRLLDELLHGEPTELDPSTLPRAGPPAFKPKSVPPRGAPGDRARDAAMAYDRADLDDAAADPVALDIVGVAMLGTLPGLAKGLALNMTIPTRMGLAFELGLLTVAEQSVAATFETQGSVSFGQQSASLLVCAPRLFSLLLACAGGEYGRQSVSASGFDGPRDVSGRDLVELIAQGTLRVNVLSWLFLRGSVALLLPLLRHDYVYDARAGEQPLFHVAPVGGRAELGLGLYI